MIVGTASPPIVTKASPDVDVGGSVADVAMLLGEANPVTGTVTFRLYGPDDATCARPPVYESTVPIQPDGTASSASFAPKVAGTHRWIARYGGDANNSPAAGACNDPRESVVVRVAASPLLCGGTKIALVDVFPEGSRMVITGVAQPALAGKRARRRRRLDQDGRHGADRRPRIVRRDGQVAVQACAPDRALPRDGRPQPLRRP